MFDRCYSIPHVIHKILKNGSDLRVMIALLKAEDDFLFKDKRHGRWFACSRKELAQIALCSESTARKSRQRLKAIRVIDYRLGRLGNHKATEFRILIDNFYLADKSLAHGLNVMHTKAIS